MACSLGAGVTCCSIVVIILYAVIIQDSGSEAEGEVQLCTVVSAHCDGRWQAGCGT